MPKCRNCELYNVNAVKNARGAIMSNRAARCLWQSTEVWPESVPEYSRRVSARYMTPNEGENCKCFVERKRHG